MVDPTTVSERLLYSTLRIEALSRNGEVIGIGTGFRFNFQSDSGEVTPVIITNKHVLEGATSARFHIHLASEEEDGVSKPAGRFTGYILPNLDGWIFSHPHVDLCAVPYWPIHYSASEHDMRFFTVNLSAKYIRSDAELEKLSALEDVIMIGYPNGLWDERNNLPLIRRGITASHPAIDFGGKSVGVVDMACFPGSSGSPVMIVNESTYLEKPDQKGERFNIALKQRIILLGILYAGPQMTMEGKIEIRPIPTNTVSDELVTTTPMMIHLGYYIKAKELLLLGRIIEAKQPWSGKSG